MREQNDDQLRITLDLDKTAGRQTDRVVELEERIERHAGGVAGLRAVGSRASQSALKNFQIASGALGQI